MPVPDHADDSVCKAFHENIEEEQRLAQSSQHKFLEPTHQFQLVTLELEAGVAPQLIRTPRKSDLGEDLRP